MMKFISLVLISYISLLNSGCSILKKTEQTFPENGRYKNISQQPKQIFAQFADTSIQLYALVKQNRILKAVKDQLKIFSFPEVRSTPASLQLLRTSFDVDVITIPFKYRFPTKGFPDQLNTNFCGAIYTGLRNDVFKFTYKKNEFDEYRRMISHHGYGMGIFAGIGSTAMNPWVTLNAVEIEYDGFVLSTGIQTAIALNNLTFGLAIGVDNLMDKNKSVWIYQRKPWIGLAVGLNLN